MKKKSAGLILFRGAPDHLQILLVHPGGPFWAKKDAGSWSIPKGEFEDEEDPFTAAMREFEEETSFKAAGDTLPLDPLRQPSGKTVYAWAIKMDLDPTNFRSNTFSMEWPKNSGRLQEFPEIDRIEWFSIPIAMQKILPGQAGFLTELAGKLGLDPSPTSQKLKQSETAPNSRQGQLFS